MAKKNDLDDENINDENQGDINEADDSFGLPEIEYQPLEESEEQSPEAESTPEPEEEETPETFAYTSSDEETSYGEESGYGEETEEDVSDEPEYIPGSYTPPKQEGNKAGIIIGIVIALLVAAAAIWYLGFHRPAQKAEQARIEKQRQERLAEEQRQADLRAEEEREAREQAEAQAAAEAAEQESAEPEPGTIETISSRTSRYYVVVASAIDGDLAMDYANDLSEAGESVKIIEPYGNVKFYRVCVQDMDTWSDAQNKANELKGQYGDGVWVIKY